MNALLRVFACVSLLACHIVLTSEAKLTLITGKMCGFDPLYTLLQDHSDSDHVTIILVDTGAKGVDRYVKVKVLAFRREPLPTEVYDGEHKLELNGVRSEACDEGRPRIWNPADIPKKGKISFAAGSYMPTKAYDRHDLEGITHLTCFIARTDIQKPMTEDKQQSTAQPVIDPKTGSFHIEAPVTGGWPRFGFALNLILNRILNLFLTLTSSEGCPMFVPPGFSGGRTWGPSYPS